MIVNEGRSIRTRLNISTDAGEIPAGTVFDRIGFTDSRDSIEVEWNGVLVWIPKSHVEFLS